MPIEARSVPPFGMKYGEVVPIAVAVSMFEVGDNFYWGGVPVQCGVQPMAGLHWATAHMLHGGIQVSTLLGTAGLDKSRFDTIFRQIYNSPELNSVVWLSVLGSFGMQGICPSRHRERPFSGSK